jgi:outer membrane protein, multidrug efflux system
LLGSQPNALESELKEIKELPVLPLVVAAGDPKTLLQRRPDIRIAERNLAATVAQVGVVTADLYPRISFDGNIGYVSGSPRDFFDSDYESWTFGPGISWAAFDIGRVTAAVRAADAASEASLLQFESTVLQALEETERTFVYFNSSRLTTHYLSEAAAASTKAAELANLRYRDGVTDFITVLDAERTMLEAEDRLAQSKTDTATSLIAVYKALGGGWETIVDPGPVQQQIDSVLP